MRISSSLLTLFLIASVVFFSGCSSRSSRPAPSDTVASGARATGDRGDFISGSDSIYSEQLNADGLAPRDGSAGYFASGDYADREAYESIYFGFDEYFVAPNERPKLEAVANYLQDNPGARIVAIGHTDWHGTVEYNLGLGDRRAGSVKNYIMELGIPARRIDTLSKGKLEATEGVEKNDPAAIEDRRVDVIILD